MNILLANPRGFCAGVDRAIEIVEKVLELFPAPVFVRHEIVHNRYVVEDLRRKGAIFVEELDSVPDGSTVIFSAHGIPPAVLAEGQRRKMRIFDATCPLVTKVHLEVVRHAQQGLEVILIGHRGHPEVKGTLGHYLEQNGTICLVENEADAERIEPELPDRLAYVTQTTLSVDDTQRIVAVLKRRFPTIQGPKKADICYATQNRQDAVKILADRCDLILVVGSPNSSNSNRLREIASKLGCEAHLIDGADDMHRAWIEGVENIGVTAGASAPEVLVDDVIRRLMEWGATAPIPLHGSPEEVHFPLPASLRTGYSADGS